MRIFAADWVQRVMARMGLKEDDIIESPLVTKQIANAQRKVEAHNFDIRKNLLDFDDVNNDQRKVIYAQRDELLEAETVEENIEGLRERRGRRHRRPLRAAELDRRAVGPAGPGGDAGSRTSACRCRWWRWRKESEELDAETIEARVQEAVRGHFSERETQLGAETMRLLEKHIMLNVLDQNWKEHLARMDYLRQGIHLRGYAQKQPKQEYKKEAFELFSEMLEKVKREVVTLLARVRIRSEDEVAAAGSAGTRGRRGAGAADAVPARRCRRLRRRRRSAQTPPRADRRPAMPSPTSAATIRARAAAARSTSTAMGSWPDCQSPRSEAPLPQRERGWGEGRAPIAPTP